MAECAPSNSEASVNADCLLWRGLFTESLYRVCQDVHPRVGIQEDALTNIEDLIIQILSDLCVGQPHCVADIERRVNSSFPEPINAWAINEAQEALSRTSVKKHRDKDKSMFSIQRVHTALKEKLLYKIDYQMAIYVAAILEYIAADILKLAGNYVKNIQHSDITCQDLKVAMHADRVLMDLFYHDEDDVPATSGLIGGDEFSLRRIGSLSYEEIVRDIVHEESQHLRDVEMLIHVVRRPLAELLPGAKEIDVIFSNLLDVHEFVSRFLSTLEDTIEMSRDSSSAAIGSCFLEMAEGQEFEVYEKYAMDVMNPACIETLNALLQRKSLLASLTEQKGPSFVMAVRYILPKLLLGPIVHCFKHFEQVEMLLTQVEEESDDWTDLDNTKGLMLPLSFKMEQICSTLQRKKFASNKFSLRVGAHQSAVSKITEIQRSVDAWDGSGFTGREFIMEGPLQKLAPAISTASNAKSLIGGAADTLRRGGRRATDRYVFLFDSTIFFCKPLQPGRRRMASSGIPLQDYKFKERFHMRKLEVADRADAEEIKNAFELQPRDHDQLPFILMAKTPEEKREWMVALIMLQTRSMLERMLDSCKHEQEKKYPLILPSPDQYRFGEKDNEENIVFEDYTSSSGIPVVKGATVAKLVERVTYHMYADPKFVRTFLTTFRAFCPPQDFLDLLIQRFDIPEPPLASEGVYGNALSSLNVDLNVERERLQRFRKEYLQPVQFRVLNVIRHWVDHHWYDFELDQELCSNLWLFLLRIHSNAKMQKWVTSIQNIIERKRKFDKEDSHQKVTLTYPTEPPPFEWHLAHAGCLEEFDLMTMHPVEIARQVTLMEFDLYRAVKPIELVGAAWTKKDKDQRSPQLLKLIRHSTKFTYWLEKCIVEAMNFEERVAVVNRILEIMTVFLELNNFTGLIEIYGVMLSSAVHRLEKTKERLDPKLWKEFLKVKDLFADAHHRNYHDRLKTINPPCVPFFGMYLSNIIFLEEGNPIFLKMSSMANSAASVAADPDGSVDLGDLPSLPGHKPREPLISFAKCRKIADIIGEIQMYQNQPYCFTVEESHRLFFENLNPLGEITDKQSFETHLWTKSIEIEPKDCDKLPDFRCIRPYTLKSPGIKQSKPGTANRKVFGTSQQPPPTPLFGSFPSSEFGKERTGSQATITESGAQSQDASKEFDKAIVLIRPGQQPQLLGDVTPSAASAAKKMPPLIPTTHRVPPFLPTSAHSPNSRLRSPPPKLPPRHQAPPPSAGISGLNSNAPTELSPPLPPKPATAKPTIGSSGKSSAPPQFDFGAFDPLTAPSEGETTSPRWPNGTLGNHGNAGVYQPPRGAAPPFSFENGAIASPPPMLPPRRTAPPKSPQPPSRGSASPGAEARNGSESPPPSGDEAEASSATPPPPLLPRVQRGGTHSPPPRPPPRRSTPPANSEPAAPPLPPKTYRRR